MLNEKKKHSSKMIAIQIKKYKDLIHTGENRLEMYAARDISDIRVEYLKAKIIDWTDYLYYWEHVEVRN